MPRRGAAITANRIKFRSRVAVANRRRSATVIASRANRGIRGTPPSVDNGGPTPALYTTENNRGTPPSVDYGRMAPGLNLIDSNRGTPRRWTTAARLPLFIRLAVAAAPRRRLTTAVWLPRFIQLAVTVAGGNHGIYIARCHYHMRLSSRSPTNERACRFVSISSKSLSSCQATRLATSRP